MIFMVWFLFLILGVALLDQPLTTEGKRNRKSISRYVDASSTPSDKKSPEKKGKGMQLKDIPFIADNINVSWVLFFLHILDFLCFLFQNSSPWGLRICGCIPF